MKQETIKTEKSYPKMLNWIDEQFNDLPDLKSTRSDHLQKSVFDFKGVRRCTLPNYSSVV